MIRRTVRQELLSCAAAPALPSRTSSRLRSVQHPGQLRAASVLAAPLVSRICLLSAQVELDARSIWKILELLMDRTEGLVVLSKGDDACVFDGVVTAQNRKAGVAVALAWPKSEPDGYKPVHQGNHQPLVRVVSFVNQAGQLLSAVGKSNQGAPAHIEHVDGMVVEREEEVAKPIHNPDGHFRGKEPGP